MFTFDQLRAFVAVADEMHFGRAAERLKMTQPPLSRQVQSLERTLDAQLFDRTRRTITLTAAGTAFLPEARRVLALAAAASETARRTALGTAGTVNIGFTSAVGHAVLPPLLHRAAAQLPEVELVLHEMVTREQLAGLRDGTLDLGMVRPIMADDDFVSRRLPPEPLVVALPASWSVSSTPDPEGGLPSMPLTELDGRDFVMYSAGGSRYFHELLSAVFSLNTIVPRYVQRVTQVHTMLSLVDAGMGAALVPRSARTWAAGNTVLVDAPELARFPTESNLLWRAESANPALPRVLRLI